MDETTQDDGETFEAMGFLNYFNDLADGRQAGKVVYPLDEVLLLALLAVLAGAETFTDIARFGEKTLPLLRRFRPFKDGTPPHDRVGGDLRGSAVPAEAPDPMSRPRQRLVLGQVKVAEKSNEIIAIPKLLSMLAIEGPIVTIDAMGCQRDIAKTILDKKADYVLALKGNQGSLREDVEVFHVSHGAECG